MEEKQFDVAIIGSGPGGYPAAIKLAQGNKRVALIEAGEIGGTCLNRGCIPTKTLLTDAEVLSMIKHASDFGINVDSFSINFGSMMHKKDEVVKRLRSSLEGLIKQNGITIFSGFGKFIDKNKIKVTGKDNVIISFTDAIIATGSEPKEIQTFQFDNHFIHSSTSILECTTLFKSLAIVGGGVIGVEFASLFSELGVKITIIEALDRILPLESLSISSALTKSFKKRDIEMITSGFVQEIKKNPQGVTVILKDGRTIDADASLVAIGRELNSSKIGLDTCGVQCEKGSIVIDEMMKTNIPGIYAIGDVTFKSLYAHVATHQGLIAANNILGHPEKINYNAVPGVIFTHPEIGTCGLSFEAAQKKGYKAKIATYPLAALGKAQASQQTEGFAEIVIDTATGQILGGQIVGYGASILIAQIALAISNELTIECITNTIHAHPTLSEVWMEGAFLVQDAPLHFPPVKK